MPILVDRNSPESLILGGQRVFLTDSQRTAAQGLRAVEIAICNLIPTEEDSETQFMRLLSNSPLPLHITLVRSPLRIATDGDEWAPFRKSFDEARDKTFDGMIVTGVPDGSGALDKSDLRALKELFRYTRNRVGSTLFCCLAAQLALHYFYGIRKHPQKEVFGVLEHQKVRDGIYEPLMRGISDEFPMPHARHIAIHAKDVLHVDELKVLAYSKRAGASVIKSVDDRQVFVTGHMEYDRYSLKNEYERARAQGREIKPPVNYFADKEQTEVKVNWTSSAHLFYCNWLNHCVYRASDALTAAGR